jgi:hypothetical protein
VTQFEDIPAEIRAYIFFLAKRIRAVIVLQKVVRGRIFGLSYREAKRDVRTNYDFTPTHTRMRAIIRATYAFMTGTRKIFLNSTDKNRVIAMRRKHAILFHRRNIHGRLPTRDSFHYMGQVPNTPMGPKPISVAGSSRSTGPNPGSVGPIGYKGIPLGSSQNGYWKSRCTPLPPAKIGRTSGG